jgi:hypothetical protein
MAYNNYCSVLGYNCTRLQWWSNPTKTWLGAPMGNASARNFLVLNATDYTVANFRSSIIGSDFNSGFNGTSDGWAPVSGTWAIDSGMYYQSAGEPNLFSSAQHVTRYGDLTYQVRMKRTGTCTGCANHISIRGVSSPLDAAKNWAKEYKFSYNNNGQFSVKKVNGSSIVMLKGWTANAAIVVNDWNNLRVIAVGNSLKFFINGTLVWSGTDATFRTGMVGFGFFRNADADILQVDWANLATTATADPAVLEETSTE